MGRSPTWCFADLSRSARNVADQSVTLATLKRLGITPVSCDETIEDSAAGKLSVNLLGVVNQFYSDNLSERIKYRMSAGVQQGRWLWQAPVGYVNAKEGLRLDPQRADLVRKAFELVATRSYGLEEVLRRITVLGLVTKRGRPLDEADSVAGLRNQLYAGWVVSGENKVKGIHEPLVSAVVVRHCAGCAGRQEVYAGRAQDCESRVSTEGLRTLCWL